MSAPSDNDVRVQVQAQYVHGQSDPLQNRYVFAYTVTISNHGRQRAKLLTRHWLITNGDGQVQEVRGDGVVGEQPDLDPGESYRYTSGTVIETPVGTMQGSYQMVAVDGSHFDALIPAFTLSVPHSLH